MGLLVAALAVSADESCLYVTDVEGKTTTVAYDTEGLQCYYWWLNDGDERPFYLSVVSPLNPSELEYSEENRPLWPEESVKLEMLMRDLKEISLTEPESKVEGIAVTDLRIDVTHGLLTLSGVNAPTKVAAYTLDGTCALHLTATADMTIDLTTLGSGVYAVSVGERNFKILIP